MQSGERMQSERSADAARMQSGCSVDAAWMQRGRRAQSGERMQSGCRAGWSLVIQASQAMADGLRSVVVRWCLQRC